MRAATLEQIARALDARFNARVDWNGEALDRLLDERHAAAVEQVMTTARELGWEVLPEVTFAIFNERGSIDVLAWHARTATVLVCEVKSVLPDVQGMLAALDRKVRLAPEVAARHGWRPERVVRLLAIEDSRTSRRRVELHAATFAARFPDRTVAVRHFLGDPASRPTLNGLWFLSASPATTPRHRMARRPGQGRAR